MEEFRAILNLSNTYGLRRIGFLHSDSEVGRAHLENVRRIGAEFGMQVVLPAALKSGASDADLQEIANRIVADKVEVFFKHGSYTSYAKVVQQARKLGATTHFMAVNSGSSELARLLGDQGGGIVFAQIMPLPYSRTTELATNIQRAMKLHFLNEPLSYATWRRTRARK
jgi:ABC-type branched-subunit amino acid transport system substrate-binding protein